MKMYLKQENVEGLVFMFPILVSDQKYKIKIRAAWLNLILIRVNKWLNILIVINHKLAELLKNDNFLCT